MKTNIKQSIQIALGCFCVVLAIFGIILPGLPTTPFLLVAAWLFVRSSPKLHKRLISNKYLGPYILKYESRKGLTIKEKAKICTIIIGMSSLSAYFMNNFYIQIIIGVLCLTGVLVVSTWVKTIQAEAKR
ncbi:YbaN family protein [Aureibacter tunicatorum]|uniref:DUF454 domain-containing protein n=1 Tax=Aureibacter tunicatorum TaxID=866807 RepID=A0AAE3XL24_9BACT|nr:YbaN family protein [Aureibacter tunicatorum]MDR6239826.1 hypothetical protein [Aureibacter tunicatorum]BDD04301.1 hypothetical protein AUTU_17840 [Aureibacter tunicatorum]